MRKRTSLKKRLLIGSLVVIMIFGAVAVGVVVWYFNRPLPPEMTNQQLFEGITYTRIVETEPLHRIIHIAKIDLTADGLSFLVTPPRESDDFDFTAQTTSQFLDRYDLQLAVNGDYFSPWRDNGILDYYPHVGDGTNGRGLAASLGAISTTGYAPRRDIFTVYLNQNNQVSFFEPDGEIYNAVSGNAVLVRNGKIPYFSESSYQDDDRHPRTSIGLTQDGNTLIIIVVDGRQPNYSEGITLPDLAQILLEQGAYDAINLDGGGSSTIVMESNGEPLVLNSPVHNHLPNRQRPTASHLGIYAKPRR